MKGTWKEAVMDSWGYYPGIRRERLMETTKKNAPITNQRVKIDISGIQILNFR